MNSPWEQDVLLTDMKNNLDEQMLWGSDEVTDINVVFHSCMGYASTPGWAFLQREVISSFGSFEGLRVIELGCGLGKVSLLFSLLGARTTLVDYNEKQLSAAKLIHEQFRVPSDFIEGNLLHLPETMCGQYDISMSFGTAEHFWDADRQRVFDAHAKVLKRGGLAVLWVPNRYGFLFHLGRSARRLLRRPMRRVEETPFTRKELYRRAKNAGLTDVQIKGGGLLRNDFCHFVVDFQRMLGLRMRPDFSDIESARDALRRRMRTNSARIRPWNDVLSYPLVLVGRRR